MRRAARRVGRSTAGLPPTPQSQQTDDDKQPEAADAGACQPAPALAIPIEGGDGDATEAPPSSELGGAMSMALEREELRSTISGDDIASKETP